MALPTTIKACKCIDAGVVAVKTVPMPTPRPDQLLVKVSTVALNPSDWKHLYLHHAKDATCGVDYAGTVVEIGAEVKKSFNVGDRVSGKTFGQNKAQLECGAFGEYAVVKGDIAMRIPSNIRDEEAAAMGVSITTIGQALYQSLGLPMPSNPSTTRIPILIYGGSSVTGLCAIQYAKLSGLQPIVTCSPRNNDLVKKYGAEAVFDYRDPDCASSIRAFTNNTLEYAFDTIGSAETARICADALSSEGKPKYTNLSGVLNPRKDVWNGYTYGYTAFNEYAELKDGRSFPPSQRDFEHAVLMWDEAETLMREGKVKAPPLEIRQGGLDAVAQGLLDLKENRVSGVKLILPLTAS